jgi:tripartite-type tricarboxylate transporter receptor subunit TctC
MKLFSLLKKINLYFGVFFIFGLCSIQSIAQEYPTKPITLVVGFGPGGNADIVARLLAQKLSTELPQPVLVENKGGAGGLLANDSVAKSTPDGYRLSLISGAFPSQAAVMNKLPFDPMGDFSWVSTFISYPMVIVVNSESPIKTLNELIKYARENPKKLNYPTPGNGSLFHLTTEYFSSTAGIDMTHIPFKGGSPQLNELLAGRLDVMFDTFAVVQPHLISGKLRAIAVTSEKRMSQLPNIPAVAETFPGFEASSFLGIAGPKGLSPEIISKLNASIHAAVIKNDVRLRFSELGGQVWIGSPKEMAEYVAQSIQKWKRVVSEKSIKFD